MEVLVVIVIISVLAAMLLPALAAARETARRKACGNNLMQTAIAMAFYTANHAEYFPCTPGWGEEVYRNRYQGGEDRGLGWRAEAGRYRDRLTGQWVGTHYSREDMPGNGHLQLIGLGLRNTPAAVRDLQMAPLGLGYLLTGSYLPDARSFYCPSSWATHAVSGTPVNFPKDTNADLYAWTRAGGYEGKFLTHGDWTGASNIERGYPGAAAYSRGALCSYAYRNVWNRAYDASVDDGPGDYAYTVNFTRPVVTTNEGCPLFKTTRDLGFRAVAADAFGSTSPPNAASEEDLIGRGVFGHREGYNVLYNDGSMDWYGDMNARIIYWNSAHQPPKGTYDQAYTNTTVLVHRAGDANTLYNRPDSIPAELTSVMIYHLFDVANDVDVDAGPQSK